MPKNKEPTYFRGLFHDHESCLTCIVRITRPKKRGSCFSSEDTFTTPRQPTNLAPRRAPFPRLPSFVRQPSVSIFGWQKGSAATAATQFRRMGWSGVGDHHRERAREAEGGTREGGRAQSNYRKTGNGEKEESSVLRRRPLREPLFGQGRVAGRTVVWRLGTNKVVRPGNKFTFFAAVLMYSM